MKRIVKIVLLSFIILLFNPFSVLASDGSIVADSSTDWDPVMNAIIYVESRGYEKAVSGNSVGAMQITPILIVECNNLLKKKKSKKRFKLSDRFSISKSKEMFLLIQSYYNPTNNIEKAIRMWNGGFNYSVKRTQKYFERVMTALKH
jgi:hypothetical protein